MSRHPDPIKTGLANGWKVYGGPHAALPDRITCDVAIVGTGAGAGITAELLTKAGLDVVLIEEGPLKSSTDFNQKEAEAYPQLYQESAGRKTADKAINILQGRCVGGSTTVNWTSSFRTPAATLGHWQSRYGLSEFGAEALAPWFAQAEARLNVAPWQGAPNTNNELLRKGASRLGVPTSVIPRNVKACLNLGSCGLGCPANAKQSMLITTIPAALERGARLLVQTQARYFEWSGSAVQALYCQAVASNGAVLDTAATVITAKHYVVSAGAINSPALLLRSKVPDPFQHLGKRTFLHPVVLSAALFDEKVEGWQGAPQSLYTDHFQDTQPLDGPIGFKLEAPPIHPVIFSTTVPGFGQAQASALKGFPHTHALLALLRDGFHELSQGGTVRLAEDGSPSLDYPLTDYVMEGAKRALLAMAQIQFAAGARTVTPVHELAQPYSNWGQAQEAIKALPMKPYLTRVVSAHVMGGCALGAREADGVIQPSGQHWQLSNLSVYDGSIFPTSIGANPQLSIYGIVNKLATGLAKRITGKDVALA
jgi:choline dehydrogenase-like flavoprotein